MGMVQVFFFFFLALFVEIGDFQSDCHPSSCTSDGPVIRYPLRLKGMPQYCSHNRSGFELACKGNGQTVLDLPYSGEVSVQSISYSSRLLLISNPEICPAALLLNLNATASPFLYPGYPNAQNFTFLTCSEDVTSYAFHKFPCVSGFGDHVFLVRSSLLLASMPRACNTIKTVEIPTSCHSGHTDTTYYYYYDDFYYCTPDCCTPDCNPYFDCLNRNGSAIYLNWYEPECNDCELRGGICRIKKNSSGEIECSQECNDCQSKGRICRLKINSSSEIEKINSSSEIECVTHPHTFHPQHDHRGSGSGSLAKYLIIGVSICFFLLIVAMVIVVRGYHSWNSNRKKKTENNRKVEKFLQDYKSLKPTRYTYADIKRMTSQFKIKLGQGGFGSVFKGELPNGISVAVKVLKKSIGDSDDFINEVGTIGMIHHINVVRLLGFCADGFNRALIYEFMSNESLEKFIFSVDAKIPSLGWEKLEAIGIGIARGIEYLHQGCNQRILHFDIKPHNILLDHNFNPKISDFGLAKLCSKERSIVSITAARGTMGYIAPEMVSRNFGKVSYKSDVYSFGMLLLEMVGGRKNIDTTVENTSQAYFPEWIYNRLNQGAELGLRISEAGDAQISKKLTIIALWCIQWFPVDRPSMKSVIQMLEANQESLVMPPNPFASTDPPKTDATSPENARGITKLEVISE